MLSNKWDQRLLAEFVVGLIQDRDYGQVQDLEDVFLGRNVSAGVVGRGDEDDLAPWPAAFFTSATSTPKPASRGMVTSLPPQASVLNWYMPNVGTQLMTLSPDR